MIGTDGQYLMHFSLKYGGGIIKDFIKEENMITLKCIEEAGNVLPIIEMSFTLSDESVFLRLNEGNRLEMSFGKDQNDLTSAEFTITRVEGGKVGESKYRAGIFCIYTKLPYVSVGKKEIYDGKSGVEAIKAIASANFPSTDFNISKSNDVQNWVQYNIPDKKFVNEIWMHSYVPNSFIAIGIGMEGVFILKDIAKAVGEDYKYRFTPVVESESDIVYEGDYFIESNHGFFNHWMGYGREKHLYNIEDGTEKDELVENSPMLALANSFSRSVDIAKRMAEAGIVNDNVHPNYWKAFLQNMQYLALFSSSGITLSWFSEYVPIKVLDIVMFRDSEIRNQTSTPTHQSGKYIVSKVVRSISNRQYVTTVKLCKESFNEMRGDLR